MPASKLPPASELRRLVDRGLSHAQIADYYAEKYGVTIKRSSVSSKLHRAGATQPLKKYTEEMPWDVQTQHQAAYPARMLRLLGARRAGARLHLANQRRLDSWLSRLVEEGAVTVYLPDSPDGFYYIPGEWDAPDLPIKAAWPEE